MSEIDDQAIRAWFAIRCRDPRRRTDGRKLQIAHRWEPFTVRDPDHFGFFTEAGAWDYIADCLEAGKRIDHLPPNNGFDDYAIYMLSVPAAGDRRIYMKVAVKQQSDIVIGISFHYSTEEYRH
ncbi:MAG: hypothetical protein EOO61_05320 [Hymenobacter sp.]|nr:MAG: hypothetical protein EOO61_05320 [Hymenobacter sp.]